MSGAWVQAIEMASGANPKDLLEVLENADHLLMRQAALCGKHVDMILRIQPANVVTGGEPHPAFGCDADRLCFEAGQALGNGPEASIVGPLGIDAEQATFGGEVDLAPGIESQCRGMTKRIVDFGEGQLVKDAAFHVGDAPRSDDPDSARGSQNELVHIGAGKALLETKAQNMIAVEAKETIGRADPDEAVLVLQDAGG